MDGQQTSQFQKDFALAVQALKNAIVNKTVKQKKLITDWLVKWSVYLAKEDRPQPYRLYGYKQGQIVLADFGFRVGNEMGGRHYAVVVERNCNPKSGVICLVPISSYEPQREKARDCNVDLGIGFIANNGKGAEVVINQFGEYSKIRVECIRPEIVPPEKFNQIISKIYGKIPLKT